MAILGSLFGGLLGGLLGYGLGYAAGRINELTLTGEALDDLYVGFADFAPNGMSFFGMLICGIVGAISGFIGAAVASLRKNAWNGILAAGFVAVVALLASGLLTANSGHWHEDQIVWTLGSIAGASSASVLTRLIQRSEDHRDHEETAQISSGSPTAER